jgi:DnaJ-domain-containing protein 1
VPDRLVRVLYRLGRQSATGVLTVAASETLVVRRGHAIGDRHLGTRLARLASLGTAHVHFDGGTTGLSPPGAHGIPLARWARAHLEQQLDNSLADVLVRDLAGIRLAIRPELAPDPLDEADRRMLAAMDRPRRLDQIWPLARTPRFRLLAFVHFLRGVDALELVGVAASAPMPDLQRLAARRMLGVDEHADREAIKRAYRRLARALHPDLQPDADETRRRTLAHRFAEVTAAYEALV